MNQSRGAERDVPLTHASRSHAQAWVIAAKHLNYCLFHHDTFNLKEIKLKLKSTITNHFP